MMDQLARTAMKCSRLMEIARPNRRLPSPFFISPRLFSTEASKSGTDFPTDIFLQTPATGLVYGKITNIRRYTTKTDILNMLECSLTPQNVKLEYSRSFLPLSAIVEFPSPAAFNAARRAILRKNVVANNITKITKSQWEDCKPYDGKAVVMLGIPRNALVDDVERFLSGCQYDSSSIQLYRLDQENRGRRMGFVRFPTQTAAMHAFITKNRGFCLNDQVSMQVLY